MLKVTISTSAKRLEKELTKVATVAKKHRLRNAKKQRAIDREVQKSIDMAKIMATQVKAKRAYKAK